jgi:uncharacterized protein YbaP (TraB family)
MIIMNKSSTLFTKIISVSLFLTSCVTFLSFAQDKSCVLWRISGNGLQQESYLLGTIHTVSYDVIKSYPVIEELIKKSHIGIFETAGNAPSNLDPELEAKAYPPLDSIFTKEEYKLVDSFFIAAGYGSIKEHNDDASLYGMIHAAILAKESPSSSTDMFFDTWIEEEMTKSNKSIIQLDDNVMRARHDLQITTPRQQAVYLVKYISGLNISKILNDTLDVRGYISTMTYDLKLEQNPPISTIYRQWEERNNFWIPKIENQMKKNTCFIATGVGHLQYNTGLVKLLKKKGYKLTPIILNKI